MTFLDSIILGIIQGFTEFLPISSSGHLVLGQRLLNLNMPGNQLEIVMHMGTLLSILVVFRNDIFVILKTLMKKETQFYVLALILGTLPAVVVGLGFKEQIEVVFDSVLLVGINLI
ncbi:MAG: undecaprenyl-diphosphatase, partial [Simkaniaceae bacterium]|nr:undecaprenyl-diphosphatase [Simkaniaceae bacterium]